MHNDGIFLVLMLRPRGLEVLYIKKKKIFLTNKEKKNLQHRKSIWMFSSISNYLNIALDAIQDIAFVQ
jgi:hypothetical protein